MLGWLTDPFASPIVQRALAELLILSLACGPLGVWVLLYRDAYAAESISHGMLPGLVLAALAGAPLLLGAIGGVLVAAAGIALVARDQRLGADVGVAVCVSTLFGLGGLLALSPDSPPRLQELLFGDLLGVSGGDLAVAGALAGGVALALLAGHRSLALGRVRPRLGAVARRAAAALGARAARRPRGDDGRGGAGARQPAARRARARAGGRGAQPRAPARGRARAVGRPGRARRARPGSCSRSTSRSPRRLGRALRRGPGAARAARPGWPLDPLTSPPRVRDDRRMGEREATSYEAVAHELLADPAVSAGKLFGHPCLKIGGKVFVCEHEGELLAKLPPSGSTSSRRRAGTTSSRWRAQDERLGEGARARRRRRRGLDRAGRRGQGVRRGDG